MEHDLIIKNGNIIDGTGSAAYSGDISIKDGIITDIVIIFHELNINLLYWFIGIHILAATYHRLKRDGVWSSMVPFFKEKNPK